MLASSTFISNPIIEQARFRAFVVWQFIIAFCLESLLLLFFFFGSSNTALLETILLVASYKIALCSAFFLVHHRTLSAARLTLSTTLLLAAFLSACITPTALTGSLVASVLGLSIALPSLNQRSSRRLLHIVVFQIFVVTLSTILLLMSTNDLSSSDIISVFFGCLTAVLSSMAIWWHQNRKRTTLDTEHHNTAEQHEAQRQVLERHKLLALAKALLEPLTINEVLDQTQAALHELLHFDAFALYWLDSKAGVVRSRYLASGGAPIQRFTMPDVPLGKGIVSSVINDGAGMLVNHAERDPRTIYQSNMPPEVEHLIATPVRARNHTLGVFLLSRITDQQFTQQEFELAQLLFSYASLGIANAHLLEEMRVSETNYRTLFTESRDVIFRSTPGGKLIDINQAGVELFGRSYEELLALPDLSMLYTNAAHRERFKALMARDGFVQDFEFMLRRPDGQDITVLETATVVRNEQSEIISYRGIIHDITKRKHIENALRDNEERFRSLVSNLSCAIYRYPINGEASFYMSDAIERITGFSAAAFTANHLLLYSQMHAEDFTYVHQHINNCMALGQPFSVEYRVYCHDGSLRWLADQAQPVSEQGKVLWYDGTIYDITDRKHTDAALKSANVQLEGSVQALEQRTYELTLLSKMSEQLQLCRTIPEACAVVGQFTELLFPTHMGTIALLSSDQSMLEPVLGWGNHPQPIAAFAADSCQAVRRKRLLGGTAESDVCTHVGSGIHATVCVPLVSQEEVLGVLHLTHHAPLPNGSCDHVVQLATTISEALALACSNLQLRGTLIAQAIRDPLTGLYNRRYMEEALLRELRRAQRNGTNLGIAMLDLDHFKRFNDTFGHPAGDTLLREVGAYLREHIRAEDIACRYGGEEFTLIMPDAALPDMLRRAEELRQGINRLDVRHRGQALGPITMSVGIAVFPSHAEWVEPLLRVADSALYQAKQAGRNCVVVGTPSNEPRLFEF